MQQLIRDYIALNGFEVVLFGSARYGVDTLKSDLDLVVLVRADSTASSRCVDTQQDQTLPEGFTPGAGQNLSSE